MNRKLIEAGVYSGTLTEQELALLWHVWSRDLHSFEGCLFESMLKADAENLRRLALVFPDEANAIRRYQDGTLARLCQRALELERSDPCANSAGTATEEADSSGLPCSVASG